MGKAYQSGENIVVELTTGDVVKRFFATDGKDKISIHEGIRKIAWQILNTHPVGMKLVEGKEFKWGTVEALDGAFEVTFWTGDIDASHVPDCN